ncbi:MAG: disulfide oxidoreductase, partial [Pseudomonadota bacterium]
PQVQALVADEAGVDIDEQGARRLQHFMDRKIDALFEPLLALKKDEALAGMARGFAFQLVEGLGVLDRNAVASDVKSLDQDARGALRKHGVRFGQFTIFMPLMLKPAPTRLRLVLWSLAKGLQEFPDSPPPGLVTVPTDTASAEGYHLMAGYRAAGDRAIRVDMAERLADMLRSQDSRGGFEANPDMLSITGMTLEQFANLMEGLGYKAVKAEREKAKPVIADAAATPSVDPSTAEPATDPETAASESSDAETTKAETAPADATPDTSVDADAVAADTVSEPATTQEDTGPELEIYYTFTWGGFGNKPRKPNQNRGGQNKGKPRRGQKGAPNDKGGAKSFQARPPKKEKAIDPDNPFAAALMGLKSK